ncbi:hypothetical protein A9F13_01g04686 [Clavispora lusitaniae]|nr:hypothetical protein A9F13_01g04686 [Clavispora lusitaniae]
MLRALSPQQQNLLRAAHFALKHSENEDYLYFAIMDSLDDQKVELNMKSTIFQYIDVLIHESFHISQQTNSHYNYPYVHNLKTSLPKILLKVLPASSNPNLNNIFNSLCNISESLNVNCSEYKSRYKNIESLLSKEELESIDMDVRYPEINLDEIQIDATDPVIQAWEILLHRRKQSHYERIRLLKNKPYRDDEITESEMFSIRPSRVGDPSKKVNELMLSKKQILSRMEDDRETHKKSKETLWVVNRPSGKSALTEVEFANYYWNRSGNYSEKMKNDFFTAFDELNKIAAASYKDQQF